MSTWIAVLAVGLGSYVLRVGPLLLRERFTPTPAADDMIRLAGTAALSALLVTSCLRAAHGGSFLPVTVALVVGGVLAARGASIQRIVAAGLAAQWAILLVHAGLS